MVRKLPVPEDNGLPGGSERIFPARNIFPFHNSKRGITERLRDRNRPHLKTAGPFSWLAAMYWDRAVWMEPAQTAKAILNSGWIIL